MRWRRRLGQRIGGLESAFLRATYAVPRPVVLLSAGEPPGATLWPIDWHMPVALDPPGYAVALHKGGYGTSVVLARREFVVNVIPSTWEAVILRAGAMSGAHVDKFAALGLSSRPAERVSTVRLTEAQGFLECRVDSFSDVGSHLVAIARVVHANDGPTITPLTHAGRS